MLAGASGSGKTTVALQCVRQMQDDLPNWLGLHGAGVAWITADRAAEQTVKKAKDIGIEIVEFYDLVGDNSIPIPKLRGWLKQNPDGLLNHILRRFKKTYDILVIDPIGVFIGGDMNSYQDVLISLLPISRRAHEKRIAILGITHSPKQSQGHGYGKPQDLILGSNAFQGYCDTLHILLDKPGDPIKTLYTRSHTAPETWVKLCQQGAWFTDDPMDFPTGTTDETTELPPVSKSEVVEWMCKEFNLSRATVYRILKKMGEDS